MKPRSRESNLLSLCDPYENAQLNLLKAAKEDNVGVIEEMVSMLGLCDHSYYPLSAIDQALLCAAESGHVKAVEALLKNGASPNYPRITYTFYSSSNAPLHIATRNGHLAVVQLLIKKGAKIGLIIFNGDNEDNEETALQISIEKSYTEITEELLKKACIQENDTVDEMVGIAVRLGYVDVINKVIENIVDINVKIAGSKGDTLLHIAASNGKTEVIKMLLKKGAYIESTNDDQATPLIIAASKNQVEAIKVLCEYKAKIEAKTEKGYTALHLAASNGHTEAIRILLKKGADIKVIDHKKNTALHLAAFNGHTEAIRILLENKANIEALNEDNKTALDITAVLCDEVSIKLLVNSGANVTDKMLQRSIFKDNLDIIQILALEGLKNKERNRFFKLPAVYMTWFFESIARRARSLNLRDNALYYLLAHLYGSNLLGVKIDPAKLEKKRSKLEINGSKDQEKIEMLNCKIGLGIFFKLTWTPQRKIMSYLNSGPLTYTWGEDRKARNIAGSSVKVILK